MRPLITGIQGLVALVVLALGGMTLPAGAAGANIVWVSFHPDDDTPSQAAADAGFTQAPDAGYTQLLRSAGHTVTRVVTSSTPDVEYLETFDLIIISRSVGSGNYQTPESTALWNGVTKPMMVLGGYVLRASRLGYTYGETIPDTAGPIRLFVNDPDHPIFTGIQLDDSGLMVNPFADIVTYNGGIQRGISVNTDSPVVDAVVLATVGTDTDPAYGGMIIAEIPAGAFMANASGDVLGGDRLVFLTGSREQNIPGDGAGIFDLTQDGARLFLNAVSYMTGVDVTEPPPLVSELQPGPGTTQYYAPRGLSFRVTSTLAGGIPEDGISLVLNGEDVSEDLTVTGTPQDRQVSYSGLAADTEYTAVITITDAVARSTVVNLTFDTLSPYVLSPDSAYPADAGAERGFRGRIVQSQDFPVLANTLQRAEDQLAGTLINPDTGEPYENLATPSTDNPDGAYNLDVVNFSVQAEQGVERGSFQAPAFPDVPFPGQLPYTVNIAMEIIAWLELEPGRHVMGVNSDDGFAVFTGVDGRDLFASILGRFEGGRGAADTLFQFEVAEAGLYPFRLVYYQGDGEGNVEWFMADPLTGEKTLINDPDNPDAVRAWRQLDVPARPYLVSLSPAPGEGGVDPGATLTAVVQEDGATVESVELTLNGESVDAQISHTGSRSTITHNPSEDLETDTSYSVELTYTDSEGRERTISYEFETRFVPTPGEGVNIVWVSFHPADDQPSDAAFNDGFTSAPDAGYTELLTAAGHNVTRYVTTATPDTSFLETFDLVIVSRSNPSGNFDSPESTALWNGLAVPTIHLGGYALRASRLGFVTGETLPDTTGPIRLKVNQPNHPIFAGIDLDESGVMTRDYAHIVTHNGTVQRGISVNMDPVATGAQVLATVGTQGDAAFGGIVIAEFPAGTTMANETADVTATNQLMFLTGSREQGFSVDAAGIYDLDGAGARLFLNAVNYMAGLTGPAPSEVAISIVEATGDSLVLSWPEAGSENLVLRRTASLGEPAWEDVEGEPTVADGQRTITIPISGTAQFFALFEEE